jgi:drug/metabolite transporter (DMT)-like permease
MAPSLPVPVVLAVLLAALLHATWNSIAHAIDDRLAAFVLIGVADTIGGGLLVWCVGPPAAASWPLVIASAAVHVGYNVALMVSYRLGEFSQSYPVARGTAPAVVLLVSVFGLHRAVHPNQVAGILAICAGLVWVVLAGGRPGRAQLPSLLAAVATGLLIALYTVIDGIAVGMGQLLGYIGWLFLLQGPPVPLFALVRRRVEVAELVRRFGRPGLLGGFVSLAAYSIVLWAQTSGALAPIAALRESSIVFGALFGAVFLGERLGTRRAVAAAVVLAGIVALSL